MDKASIIKALRDTAQSASNAIAGNVSGPVDLLAAGLRMGGLPIPQNPVGGSQWMQELGLTREVEMGAPRLVGETLGMAGPAVVAAKAPQIASGINQAAANAMAPRTLNPQAGAIVWHGSPHKFDKFDASKIGTGEGAQAYGHGLYLAENQGVAEGYKNGLSAPNQFLYRDLENVLPNELKGKASDWSDAILQGKGFDDLLAQVKLPYQKTLLRRAKPQVDELIKGQQSQGSLYKVDLPDEHIAKMLDWDKPLSQQPQEVRQAIDGIAQSEEMYKGKYAPRFLDKRTTAGDVVGIFGDAFGGPSVASNYLRDAGIPGIRYLDGGSRGTGAGTSNFVVFPGNEDILKILERNGQPLGMMGIR